MVWGLAVGIDTIGVFMSIEHRAKEYLGDGLYAAFDGYHIVLSAEDGIRATDTVYLEDGVLNTFFRYVERIYNVEITVKKKSPNPQAED